MRLSSVVLALLPGLAASSAYAAVYQVQELPEVTSVRSQFAAAMNDNGDIVGSASFIYDFPVDIDGLDFENSTLSTSFTEDEIVQIKQGNIDAEALTILLSYLSNNSTNYQLQRYSDVQAFNFSAGTQVKVRETAEVPTNREYIYDINASGNVLALATTTFTQQSFTPAATETTPSPATVDLWVPDSAHMKSYIMNGSTKTALPIPYEDLGGGFSVGNKISNANYIAGSGSVGMPEATVTSIEDSCDGDSAPISLCYYTFATSSNYIERALVWQINDSGQISAPEQYGYLGPKIDGTEETSYVSRALSVNDSGIAVGYSTYTNEERGVLISHATMYDNKEVAAIVDPLEWDSSSAVDINNGNIVVGNASKVINGSSRNKFFVFDYNTNTVTFPTDFFNSSNSIPAAINDNNMVVGAAEIIPADSTSRRQVAFLYDMSNSTFTDLNTLLPCSSNVDLVEAIDINNNNEIVANAVVAVEQRDAKGELVKDSAGNPVMENVSRPVKLVPVANGTIEDCNVEEDLTYERKGGSASWFSLLLLPLLYLRRRTQ